MPFLLVLFVIAAIVFVVKGVIIVEQQEVVIIQRLGKYLRTLEAGFNVVIPFLDVPRPIAKKITKQTYDGCPISYTTMSDRPTVRQVRLSLARTANALRYRRRHPDSSMKCWLKETDPNQRPQTK